MKKCAKKGFELFIEQLIEDYLGINKPSMENFVALRDFKDVFHEEIPTLPPKRDIDFIVDLILGASLISKASYRMRTPYLSVL